MTNNSIKLRNMSNKETALRLTGLALLLVIFAAEICFVTRGGYLYGNDYDWTAQHVELPSYMRQLFYKTGKFFPDFAMNLGAGQNIYYIAYYGLFSPIILLSYLLPSVPMITYMTAASIVLTALSIFLIWRWLNRHLTGYAAFAAALMFTLAIPVMYHSHHHLMFVNYLPFMILAMEGMEKYVEKGKRLQLILSVYLIIMCSFFFSVGAIMCLFLYWILLYGGKYGGIKKKAGISPQRGTNFRIWLRTFSGRLLRLIGLLIIPVLMSAVVWLPLLHVVLAGRSDTTVSQSLKDMIFPSFQDSSFFYQTGGMGLTAVFLLCIAGCVISHSRRKRLAGILFLIMMFFGLPVYLLNGGMYINGKVLIPFLPLAVLLFGGFLEDTVNRQYSLAKFLAASAIIVTAAVLTWQDNWSILKFFVIDTVTALGILLLLYCRPWKTARHTWIRTILCSVLLIPALILSFIVNDSDTYLRADENPRTVYGSDAHALLKTAEQRMKASGSLARTDLFYNPATTTNYVLDMGQLRSGIYSSLNNGLYHNYFFKEAGNEISGHSNAVIKPVKNPMNALRLGVRYIIGSRKKPPVKGYRLIAVSGNLALYENTDALPIGYVATGDFRPAAVRMSAEPIMQTLISSCGAKSTADGLSLHLQKEKKITVPVTPAGTRRILQITMKVDNSSYRTKRPAAETDITNQRTGEIHISVNGIHNVLSSPNWRYYNGNTTFHFTMMLEPGADHLTLRMGKGNYTLSDISVSAWSYSQYLTWRNNISPWQVQQKSDNILTGKIKAERAGDMYISIPYDEGFHVSVDGKDTAYHKTADGFLSIPLQKGTHTVTLTFRAPLKRAGIAVSAAGFLLLFLPLMQNRRKHTHERLTQKGGK